MTARTVTSAAVYVDGVQLQHANRPTRELCIMACVFCKDPQFHAWMRELAECANTPAENAAELAGGDRWLFNDVAAKAFILSLCEVKSRNELDTNPAAAALFHKRVRLPFVEWKGEQFYAGPLGQPYGEDEPC